MKVLEFQCIIFFLRHPNSLLTIDYHAIALVSGENVWATEMLEAMHAKIPSLLMVGLIKHLIKRFYPFWMNLLWIQIAEMTPTETLIVVFLRLTKPFAEFWSSCGKGMNDLPLNGSYAIVLI